MAARKLLDSRPERQQHNQLTAADVAATRTEKATEDRIALEKLYAVLLVVDSDAIRRLNVGQSKEQLAVWRKFDTEVAAVGKLNGSYYGTGTEGQKDRIDALLAAVGRANAKDPHPLLAPFQPDISILIYTPNIVETGLFWLRKPECERASGCEVAVTRGNGHQRNR
ncbi:hypothetical protein C8F01DRAFT_1281439 [Mycena amicta]|nr:hypothetical protein C8F01DRAFT_1281439 [Mycena amicta]